MGKRLTTEEFIERSILVHGDKYDYSLMEYKNVDTKIKIICPEHGVFEQTPHHHLNGIKCPNCSHNKKITTEEFIIKSKEIHGDRYDYSLVNYKHTKYNKIKIICPIHGIFEQAPYEHKNGSGCPICMESKGERIIRNILIQKNIKYETQKKFKECKYINILSFDFYLNEYNICIEYDGEQHFKKFRFEKDNNKLIIRQKRDQIKNEYCINNNIRLIRIKFDENIEEKLNELFNS